MKELIGKTVNVMYPARTKDTEAKTTTAVFCGFGLMVDEYSEHLQSFTGAILLHENGDVWLEQLCYIKFEGVPA